MNAKYGKILITALQQQKGVNLIIAWIKMQMKGGMDVVQRIIK